MIRLFFFINLVLISCQYQGKEMEIKEDPTKIEKDTFIIDSPMPDSFYQFKKLDEDRDYSGTASCILDTTFTDLYPSAYIAKDSLNSLFMILEIINDKNNNLIGRLIFSNIPYKIGKYHQDNTNNLKFSYAKLSENGCILDSFYKLNDSIPDKSYLIINYIDTYKKIIHGEFELYLKLSDSTSNYDKKQKYMVIRKGKFKTRYRY